MGDENGRAFARDIVLLSRPRSIRCGARGGPQIEAMLKKRACNRNSPAACAHRQDTLQIVEMVLAGSITRDRRLHQCRRRQGIGLCGKTATW